ncbi:hypothetical protein C7954_10562 [Halanaerobium congolense]|uniref:Carboxypeptidase regulatory-like domain-containing protein n=1 Tax=Halanaerobium congolense TaxID=54121 RepID=A0A4R8GSW7_9FIRM|nr:hypothetical protein [Halanaerobium congolense]TDP20694.1 hypothetical protein C8C79_10956 [Halanaerobium congolense]TDX46544.1 hypothetical protein C7954_10562 [Halanaerobium congolense]
MKKYLLIILIMVLAVTLTACNSGNGLTNTEDSFVTGNVTVLKDGVSSNLSNVVIEIDNKQEVTSENGSYKIEDLDSGKATVRVLKGASNVSSKVVSQSNEDQIVLWENTINIDAGENIVDIPVNTIASVLKYYSEFHNKGVWQIAFYANPLSGKEIKSGKVIDPDGKEYTLEPHFGSQWHQYWNLTEPLAGYYTYIVEFADGTQEEFKAEIKLSDFQIDFPNLNYPVANQVIDTVAPTFEFDYIPETDKAYLRIEKKLDNDEWERLDWITINNAQEYKIKDTILEAGNDYRWTLQTVVSADVFPWSEAKPQYEYFTISK